MPKHYANYVVDGLPYVVKAVQFVGKSVSCGTGNLAMKTMKPIGEIGKNTDSLLIILGGNQHVTHHGDGPFCEIILPKSNTNIKNNDNSNNKNNNNSNNSNNDKAKFKSFGNDYHKYNADLRLLNAFNPNGGELIHSYFIKNNQYILVFYEQWGYNIYDIDNDCWLFEKNKNNIKYDTSGTRSLLLNDEILIISQQTKILIFTIAGNYLYDAKLIYQYNIDTPNLIYHCHGISCIEFNKLTNNDSIKYNFKIVLYGGMCITNTLESFLQLSMKMVIGIKCSTIDISPKLIGFKNVNNEMVNNRQFEKLNNFGYQCVFNSKNEPIIVIIGGGSREPLSTSQAPRRVMLFNLKTKSIVVHSHFLPDGCKFHSYPATAVVNNGKSIVTMHDKFVIYFTSVIVI